VAELGELRKSYGQILERGVELVAISVDPPAVSERLRQRLDFDIRFLCDTGGLLMDAVSLRHRGGRPAAVAPPAPGAPPLGPDIFLPATFLLDGVGVIRWVYRPDTYRMRASPAEVIAAIDALEP
jgi:peroxiredoxin